MQFGEKAARVCEFAERSCEEKAKVTVKEISTIKEKPKAFNWDKKK